MKEYSSLCDIIKYMKKYLYIFLVAVILGIAVFAAFMFFGKNKTDKSVQNQASSSAQPDLDSFSGAVKSNEQPAGNSSPADNSQIQAPPADQTSGASASSFGSAAAPSNGQAKHVFVVLGENQNYNDVIGNTRDMPYLNALANTYAYAKEFMAVN
jgi:predicted lipid-binding transport protein (Tim44 family)